MLTTLNLPVAFASSESGIEFGDDDLGERRCP